MGPAAAGRPHRPPTLAQVGSPGRKRGRRTRSDDGGRRADVTRGVGLPGSGRTYDPPWRSISEGRGLPRTRAYRAMMPVVLVAALAMLVLVLVGAGLSALFN